MNKLPPQDLRINNHYIIGIKGTDKLGVVKLDKQYMEMALNDAINIEPIELTENIFKEYGFTKINGWDDYKAWTKDEVEIECDVYGFDYASSTGGELKYFHHLQTLYYSHKGKELTIKNK